MWGYSSVQRTFNPDFLIFLILCEISSEMYGSRNKFHPHKFVPTWNFAEHFAERFAPWCLVPPAFGQEVELFLLACGCCRAGVLERCSAGHRSSD